MQPERDRPMLPSLPNEVILSERKTKYFADPVIRAVKELHSISKPISSHVCVERREI